MATPTLRGALHGDGDGNMFLASVCFVNPGSWAVLTANAIGARAIFARGGVARSMPHERRCGCGQGAGIPCYVQPHGLEVLRQPALMRPHKPLRPRRASAPASDYPRKDWGFFFVGPWLFGAQILAVRLFGAELMASIGTASARPLLPHAIDYEASPATRQGLRTA